MKHRFAPLSAVLLLALVVSAPNAIAQEAEEEKSIEQRREEARVERLWNLNWRAFSPHFLEHDGEFIYVPGYDRSKPSSAGQSLSEYRSKSVWNQEYEDEHGKDQSRKLTKPEEEAFAAVALIPEVAVGQYGYIHSGQIDEIIDSKTVALEDIWLLDADATRKERREMKEELWGEVIEDIRDAIEGRKKKRKNKIRDRRMIENDAIDWGFEVREEAAERQRDSVFSRYTWLSKATPPAISKRTPAGPARKPSSPACNSSLSRSKTVPSPPCPPRRCARASPSCSSSITCNRAS